MKENELSKMYAVNPKSIVDAIILSYLEEEGAETCLSDLETEKFEQMEFDFK